MGNAKVNGKITLRQLNEELLLLKRLLVSRHTVLFLSNDNLEILFTMTTGKPPHLSIDSSFLESKL